VALWLVGRRAVEVSRLPEPTRPAVVAPVPASAPIRVSAPDAEAAAELERLRAEVRDLREQLDAAHAALDQTVSTLDRTTLELERLRRPLEIDMASATLRASLVPGEGVVTGGYRLPDGNRLFAFVATDTMPDGSIGIASRFFSVPEDVARSLGLETLLTLRSHRASADGAARLGGGVGHPPRPDDRRADSRRSRHSAALAQRARRL
jgi:hypothetical protein